MIKYRWSKTKLYEFLWEKIKTMEIWKTLESQIKTGDVIELLMNMDNYLEDEVYKKIKKLEEIDIYNKQLEEKNLEIF